MVVLPWGDVQLAFFAKIFHPMQIMLKGFFFDDGQWQWQVTLQYIPLLQSNF